MAKRIRRTNEQLAKALAEVQHLIVTGVTPTAACKKVGVAYLVYKRHVKGSGWPLRASGANVEAALNQLRNAIRAEVLRELQSKLSG